MVDDRCRDAWLNFLFEFKPKLVLAVLCSMLARVSFGQTSSSRQVVVLDSKAFENFLEVLGVSYVRISRPCKVLEI